MRRPWMHSILVAAAILASGSQAQADDFVITASPLAPDAAPDAVVTIGDPSTTTPDASTDGSRVELPVVQINPTSSSAPVAPGTDVGRVDFAAPTPTSTIPVHSPRRVTTARGDDLFVDPVTGLMIPRFANTATVSPPTAGTVTRSRAPSPRRGTTNAGHLHIDPATGLMIPDFGESTFPARSQPAGRTANRAPRPPAGIRFDPTTGLMVPGDMELPHGEPSF